MSARKKQTRKPLPGMSNQPLDKPREECSYTSIYPSLDASRPLYIYKDNGSSVNGAISPSKKETNVSTKKRSFRHIEPFTMPEAFVDRVMSSVGYLESDEFEMPVTYIRTQEQQHYIKPETENDSSTTAISSRNSSFQVEYDMDEQDEQFLNMLNKKRADSESTQPISKEIFEITMTLLETEWYLLERIMPPKKKAAVTDEIAEVEDQRCTVCDEAECDNSNAIVFCDNCDIAVHQECYGVPFIPEGQWLCSQCTISRRRKAACVFCPNKIGALKPTDTQHWAHVVCALWIPEVVIRNTIYMEPITGLNRIPSGRWKLNCYICKYPTGACIQCCNKHCFQAYHPTCARKAGLYMKLTMGPLMALQDPLTMVTYCDKHTPAEYAATVDVPQMVATAQNYYVQNKDEHHEGILQNSTWRDNNLNASSQTVRATKFVRKRSKGAKVWRTAQGIPVIPNVIISRIVDKMIRFHIMRCREYVSQISRYWALKRQNRRGAALSKRLQMALDDAAAAAAASDDSASAAAAAPSASDADNVNGSDASMGEQPPLEEGLFRIVSQWKTLVDQVSQREELKLQLAETNDDITNRTYFPTNKIIEPIWQKVLALEYKSDSTRYLSTAKAADLAPFAGDSDPPATLDEIRQRVDDFDYTNVEAFINDIDFLCTCCARWHIQGSEEAKGCSRIQRAIAPMYEKARFHQAALDEGGSSSSSSSKPYFGEIANVSFTERQREKQSDAQSQRASPQAPNGRKRRLRKR